MSVPGFTGWRKARPLGLALLAALLLHTLWLAEGQVRRRRQPAPVRLERADDTPELLVFSRQPVEPLALDSVPLPPPTAMPPPPPDLPDLRSGGMRSAPAPRPPLRPRPARRAAGLSARPAARPSPAPRSAPRPGGPPFSQGRPGGPPPLPPLPAAAPLEALREARRRGPDAGPAPVEGEGQQRWRALWQGAEAGPSPPDALAARPDDGELRRLPLARARAQGLDPESGRPLRLEDHWLLPWIEGDQLWLLRTPL
jgi:hypothetical protein